jgi:hypothetical protein
MRYPSFPTYPTAHPPVPAPVEVTVCSACGQLWDDHLARIPEWDEEGNSTDRAVHLGDCLALTVEAQQGPVGPPGPTGPMGLSAPDARPAAAREAVR